MQQHSVFKDGNGKIMQVVENADELVGQNEKVQDTGLNILTDFKK